MALLVGFAMIARGEIGFLIASLSQSSGTLTLRDPVLTGNGSSSDEILLVIIWAVVLCTIIGPIGVGIVVKRLQGR
jgi:Kef-type K+ transport system membrane component KefB